MIFSNNKSIQPDRNTFIRNAGLRKIMPLFKEIPYKDPAQYYALIKGKNTFLLESIKGPFRLARYSYIGLNPNLVLIAKNKTVKLYDSAGNAVKLKNNPLIELRKLLKTYRQLPSDALPPFQGGAVGLLSYDFVRFLEKIPAPAKDDLNIPDAHFLLIGALLSFDHKDKKAWIICCPGLKNPSSSDTPSPERAYDDAANAVNQIETLLLNSKQDDSIQSVRSGSIEIHHEMTKEKYMAIVKQAKEYISAGDIFQANLSQRLSADIKGIDPWRIYERLSAINPSPFALYFDFGDYKIVSSSPERLVRVNRISDKDKTYYKVETRPIAGTRPRGSNCAEDDSLRLELLINEKERAEHIMLIDLERNDLGRVCDYGSISVDELMITEDYSHVIHIVSNVSGRLNSTKDCFDVIRAVFPGGTITGVPKVRCMEIIAELEPTARGPYTGSIGYIGFDGNMDMNIVIRTFIIKDDIAYVQAGAGIVADSEPEREYYETLKKAEALIRTLKLV
ncbi:para-aminobenzoate synthase component I [Candidatus Magnetoovum chiemensis]|nr:para-aminobenzoate synthase component I [Candidatus Magnetoovum chiemensis]